MSKLPDSARSETGSSAAGEAGVGAATGVASGARPAKRSFAIKGHQTSISLEAPFWDALRAAASEQHTTPAALVARIDGARGATGLSSAVRVWLLAYYRSRGEPPSE